MTDKVLGFINQYQLFKTSDKILATVSGGIDSVVLCELLHELKITFGIAHCNFGLRGDESDADEVFVKKLAKKYGVAFYSEIFRTQEFAQQEQVSTQMAARVLRYTWFEKIRQQQGYDYIATAHHQNDTAETILLNLVKGTGIAGLHGIPAKNGAIVRPLLALTKDDIYEYVTQQQLIWREDSSNETTKYQRNKIRHEVVPVLKEINPNLENTFAQTVKKIAGAEQIVQHYLQQVKDQVVRQEKDVLYLALAPLENVTALPVVLHELVKEYGFQFDVVEEIIQAFTAIPGKTFYSATHVLVKDREQLVITPKDLSSFGSYELEATNSYLELPGLKLELKAALALNYELPRSRKIAALDKGLLQFPLKVRTWKEGDWFVPLGMKGKKKISDFLIDEKIPLNLKSQIKVLTSDKSIVWVIGLRPDNRFKVTDKTEEILEVKVSS